MDFQCFTNAFKTPDLDENLVHLDPVFFSKWNKLTGQNAMDHAY